MTFLIDDSSLPFYIKLILKILLIFPRQLFIIKTDTAYLINMSVIDGIKQDLT